MPVVEPAPVREPHEVPARALVAALQSGAVWVGQAGAAPALAFWPSESPYLRWLASDERDSA